MAPARVRSKTAKKGYRWKKGQSSSSNPHKTRHRDQARSRVNALLGFSNPAISIQAGPSKLTAESLLKHDALLRNQDDVSMAGDCNGDAVSLNGTAKTFDTWASGLTQCTNMSFQKVIRRFDPNNAQHKEMLAILAAVTEVIKAKGGGEESSTEYLAALLTTLEVTEEEAGLMAVLTLMAMVIKTVPAEVLQAQFGTIAKVLVEHLGRHGAAGESTSIVRSLLGCLSVLLRAQTGSSWAQPSTVQAYKAVLAFTCHPKPKIRKAAQHAVVAILGGSYIMSLEECPKFHPMAQRTANDCLEKLASSGEVSTVLHTLVLLKDAVAHFPRDSVKAICDRVLGLLQANAHAHMATCAMQTLYGLLNARAAEDTLSADMNAKLISALNEYKPSVNDTRAIVAWLTVQQEALINLCFLDEWLCLRHLPAFFAEAKKCWASDQREVCAAATTALRAVCNECLRPHIEAFAAQQASLDKVKRAFDHVQEGFGYQYHAAWPQVLHLMAVVFEVAGSVCPEVVGPYLRPLAEKRSTENFVFVNELDYVVGKAVRKMGPRRVLEHIPLQITGEERTFDFPRSWLLLVLRENIQNAELSLFIEHFHPLAEKCRERSNQCLNVDDQIGRTLFQTLESHIWALLPSFCNGPTDLAESFKRIARTLGEQLNLRKDLRMDIMSSLRQLVLKNKEHEANRRVMANFAKNYLPILYNLYTKQPTGAEEKNQHQAAFETIKVYLSIAPQALCHSMFDNTFKIYEGGQGFVREAALDILRAQLPYQDESRIGRTYARATEQLSSQDHTEQKKAYRMLEEICGSDSQTCVEFVRGHLSDIQRLLLSALSRTSSSSQASRLLCLTNIVKKLDGDEDRFALTVVPETVLCVKAANEKARSRAFALLVLIGEKLVRWDPERGIQRLVEELLPSIQAESPSLINCSILALTRIFYEFHEQFPRSALDALLHNVCLLLTTQTREVVGSCIGFLRVLVKMSPVLDMTVHVEQVVNAMMSMTEDCKRYFRLKARYLLERIVRKFGHGFVSDLVPKDDVTMQKRLKNIRKSQLRKARLDERKGGGDDTDDDDDDDFRVSAKATTMEEILADSEDDEMEMSDAAEAGGRQKQRRKKARGPQTFITEKDGGIVDFLDQSAANRITSVKPESASQKAAKKQKSKDGGFKRAQDGRLIIKEVDDDGDDDDSANERDVKSRFMNLAVDSDDDNAGSGADEKSENTFQALVSMNAAKKRKRAGSIASSRRTNASFGEPAMKYQAGGTGIHRPRPEKNGAKKAGNTYGSEYKAMKAKGDVKRKGRPDPYAYIPLDKRALNKRKRTKFAKM